MTNKNISLGALPPETHAIFYQKSKSLQAEYGLISVTIARESLIEKLNVIIRAVNNKFRELDDQCILETITLFNQVREATINVIEATFAWQQGFTKNIRPQLCEIDYIVKMINTLDFVSATPLRRNLNFQLGRGNCLLLPLINSQTVRRVTDVNEALGKQINMLANPDIDIIKKCYTIMINTLSPEIYKTMQPLGQWLLNRWIPTINILSPVPIEKPKKQRSQSMLHVRKLTEEQEKLLEEKREKRRLLLESKKPKVEAWTPKKIEKPKIVKDEIDYVIENMMNNSMKFSGNQFSTIISKGFDDPDEVLNYFNIDDKSRSISPPKSPPKSPNKSTRNVNDSLDDLVKYTKSDWIEVRPDPSNKRRDKDIGKKFTIEEQAQKLSFSTSSLKTCWTKSNEIIDQRKKKAFTLKKTSSTKNFFDFENTNDNNNDDNDNNEDNLT